MASDQRDPKLDQCDEEIAATLKKYSKAIRPVPFIDAEGRIQAQIVYFDIPPEVKAESNLETPQ